MLRCALLIAAILSASLLTGCGLGTPATATPETMHLAFTGSVHGGQQPVAGARIFVFQAAAAGYGNFAFDLIGHSPAGQTLSQAQGGGYDNTLKAYYTVSNALGGFTITGDYLCNGSGPVYVLATQGNPGLGAGQTNPALAELAVVASSCGFNATLPATQQIGITEQSTVTGVYALAGYMSGLNKLSAPGETLAQTGLTNAGNTAIALSDISSGSPLATTGSGGVVPVATVNTLANILSACVNSNGTGAPCSTLFTNATSTGVAGSGTIPTDTVTALLNIAHHPAANVAALFPISAAAPPFGGGLTAAPNDFTLAVSYASIPNLVSPGIPAVDAAGNVWFASTGLFLGSYFVVKVSPTGAASDYIRLQNQLTQVAIDSSGNPWVAVPGAGVVSKISPGPGGGLYGTEADLAYNGSSNDDGHQLAIDTSGNVYISDYTNGRVYGLTNGGSSRGSVALAGGTNDVALLTNTVFLSYIPAGSGPSAISGGFTSFSPDPSGSVPTAGCGQPVFCEGGGLTGPTALAVSSNAYLWTLNNNSTLSGFDTTGATQTSGAYLPGSPFSGGGLNTTIKSTTQPYPWLAIDGANNIWVGNYTGSVSEFSPAGLALTPNYVSTAQPGGFYGVAPTCKSQGLAIDGSGNLWVSCDSATTPILEYIGIATPVATPLLPGNFGVRP